MHPFSGSTLVCYPTKQRNKTKKGKHGDQEMSNSKGDGEMRAPMIAMQ